MIRLIELMVLFFNASTTKVMLCIQKYKRVTHKSSAPNINLCLCLEHPPTTSVTRSKIHCEMCGASLAAGSHQSHLETHHDVFLSIVLQQDIVVDRSPAICRAIELIAMGTACKCNTARYRTALAW